jgi:serine/threonine-protein kinase RsbW
VSARDGQCAIEVINAGPAAGGIDLTSEPVPATAEHGRGLKIIDAVVDNLQLTANGRHGTTLHFEKTLEWLPGAPGQQLLDAEHSS